MTHTFERTDPRAELLITLTADYMKHAGIGPEDVFASYVRKSEKRKGEKAWSKRNVTAQNIREELKRAASVIGLLATISPASPSARLSRPRTS